MKEEIFVEKERERLFRLSKKIFAEELKEYKTRIKHNTDPKYKYLIGLYVDAIDSFRITFRKKFKKRGCVKWPTHYW